MARDLGKYKIRVLAIAAGLFDTPMIRSLPKQSMQASLKQQPLGSFGRPEQFAHAVMNCIENSYLNGVNLPVTGGSVVAFL